MTTEHITPKADRRIIDGQIMDDDDQAGATNAKSRTGFADAKSAGAATSKNAQAGEQKRRWTYWLLPHSFSGWLRLLLTFMIIGVIGLLVMKQQDQDWQIEQINQLQSQVSRLTETAAELRDQQVNLSQALEAQKQAAQALENKPVLSQADLAAVQSKIQKLEEAMSGLGHEAQAQAQALMTQLQHKLAELVAEKSVEQPQEGVQPDTMDQIKQQLSMMGGQISDLFKAQDQQAHTELKAEHLTAMQLQAWVLEANAQWLLEGNVQKTQAQLQALEQAAGLSDLPQKMQLIRLIGEDLAMLSQHQQEQTNASILPAEASDHLREWLAVEAKLLAQSSSTNAHPVSPTETTPSAAQAEPASAWQRLQQAFTGIFTVKKRDSAAALTQVEQTLMQDVIIQRAYLLVDQLDWAVKMKSAEKKQEALNQLTQFVSKNMPQANLITLAERLKPYEQLQFAKVQSLHVVNAL